MRLEQYLLLEKLIEINDKDITMLSNPLKDVVKAINKFLDNPTPSNQDWIAAYFKSRGYIKDRFIKTFSSGDLTSEKAILAHKLNPIKIKIGMPHDNSYSSQKKQIECGILTRLMNNIFQEGAAIITSIQGKHFKQEFQIVKIQTTIRHELTHWIDDTLHAFHITKAIGKALEIGSDEPLKMGKKDVYLTNYEINASIHAIAQYKKSYKKAWNKLTFDDLLELLPSERFNNQRLGKDWRIKIKKRMAREKLLGKMMR